MFIRGSISWPDFGEVHCTFVALIQSAGLFVLFCFSNSAVPQGVFSNTSKPWIDIQNVFECSRKDQGDDFPAVPFYQWPTTAANFIAKPSVKGLPTSPTRLRYR
jgi:hypothetical protein